jgi:hypothetical protein
MNSNKLKIAFRVHGVKKNGEPRDKTFDKINHALRYMWRIKEVQELRLDAFDGISVWALFIKVGRRRGVNNIHAEVPEGRPGMNRVGPEWSRLPSKFNDLD